MQVCTIAIPVLPEIVVEDKVTTVSTVDFEIGSGVVISSVIPVLNMFKGRRGYILQTREM